MWKSTLWVPTSYINDSNVDANYECMLLENTPQALGSEFELFMYVNLNKVCMRIRCAMLA